MRSGEVWTGVMGFSLCTANDLAAGNGGLIEMVTQACMCYPGSCLVNWSQMTDE